MFNISIDILQSFATFLHFDTMLNEQKKKKILSFLEKNCLCFSMKNDTN